MAEHVLLMQAHTRIPLLAPEAVMQHLCAHLGEHCTVTREGSKARLDAAFGTAHLECEGGCLFVKALGHDESTLAYVKMAVAEHVVEFAKPENPRIVWAGDGMASGALPFFREMHVVGAREITPRMRRLTLKGEDLGRFTTGGLHVRLLFPPAELAVPSWPSMGEDGRIAWPDGAAKLTARVYTIRSIDPARGEIEVDFVLHEGDRFPGSGFAITARPGAIVGITGPGGGGVAPADWYLLAGDETALPAIGRMLEALPPSAHAVVRIEVADAAEEQPLTSPASLDLAWLHRGVAEAGTTTLLEDAVRAVAFPVDDRRVFAWGACEHKAFRAIRKFLRADRGLTRDQHLVAAYWRRGCDADSAAGEEA